MIHPNFVYLGVLLEFIGGMSYLVDTVKGKVKPNRVTWLLWAAAPLIAFYAQITQGVKAEAITIFIVGFMPLLIFVASFVNKKAEWKIQKLDIICGIFSVMGIALWMITKVGNIAIFFSILADGLAAIPTVVKSWREPETENDLIFLLGVVNTIIGLLVIKTWHFENYAFLVYLFFVNLIFAVIIRFKVGRIFHKMLQ